jgi:peptide/nickel transport system substrate-binding protein
MADIPMIPVHYEQDIYGVRDGVKLTPRTDKFLSTFEMDIE